MNISEGHSGSWPHWLALMTVQSNSSGLTDSSFLNLTKCIQDDLSILFSFVVGPYFLSRLAVQIGLVCYSSKRFCSGE